MLYTTRIRNQPGDVLDMKDIKSVILRYLKGKGTYVRKYWNLKEYVDSIPDNVLSDEIFAYIVKHSYYEYDTSIECLQSIQSRLHLNIEQLSVQLNNSCRVYHGYERVARCLLEMGADPNFEQVTEYKVKGVSYFTRNYAYKTTKIPTLTVLVKYGLNVENAIAYHAKAIVHCKSRGKSSYYHEQVLGYLKNLE